jgi:hypothetical protein
MRKLFVTIAMVSVIGLLTHGAAPSPAAATQTCMTTCQAGIVLTCTSASGTCTSVSGTVTCCGSAHTCAAINAYNTCENNCSAAFTACLNRCPTHTIDPCLLDCEEAKQTCSTHCGGAPQTNFSC